jgi:urease accessory protein
MAWHAELKLDYTLESQRTVARHAHHGPIRILKSLYPEGDSICHNVLAHPPGGLVGGDTIDIQVSVAHGAHGLVSTPGATRFYKSGGHPALQQLTAHVADQARLEWMPLEADCVQRLRSHQPGCFSFGTQCRTHHVGCHCPRSTII